MELAAIFAALQEGWRWLAGGFALLALLAGALALVNRALGQKQGDRPRRPKRTAEGPEKAPGGPEAAGPGGKEKGEETDGTPCPERLPEAAQEPGQKSPEDGAGQPPQPAEADLPSEQATQ